VSTFVIQSRIASLVASLRVRVPKSTGLHSLDVGPLPPHVLLAHVDDAVEAEARADRRRRNAVLPGAGLGHDAPLAEAAREHRLAERIVELVRAGVEQILPLQIQPLVGRETLRARERRRPPGEGACELVELCVEEWVVGGVAPTGFELVERGNERLGHVPPAVRTERHRAAATNARTLS
jgi:hypothetical protein